MINRGVFNICARKITEAAKSSGFWNEMLKFPGFVVFFSSQ
jgi:hypothetical protein